MTKKTRHNYGSAVLFLGLVLLLSLAPLLNANGVQAQGPDKPSKPEGVPVQGLPVPPAGERMDPGQNARPISQVTAGTDVEALRYQNAGPVNVIIELTEPPAALYASQGDGGVSGQIAQVESAQNATLSAMSTQGITYTVLGTTERVLSAMLVRVDGSALGSIQLLPGVKHAYVERIGHLENSTSIPFVRAPDAWDLGYTGAGMRVGLIDSGIDYDHVNFGGNGNGVGEYGVEFPSVKIAGGYDFVGDSWNPYTSPTLVPDPDPYDQNGHGSHVAGTMAGYGVLSGAMYAGPYGSATTPFATMTIGPGVAPEATIYVYKVGSVSNYVSEFAAIEALDRATDPDDNGNTSDHLDVVNMSIGGDFGDPTYGWAYAADVASQVGVVVVSSAGNGGDTYFIQGDPSTANRAISVAASSDGSLGFEILQSPLSGIYEAASASFGPSIYDVTGTLELANDGSGAPTLACNALTGFTSGNIALIDRGTCSFTTKVYNAQVAGAVGVLIANTLTGSFGGLGAADDDLLAPLITIPSMMIQYGDGQTIRAALPQIVHLSNSIVYGATADHMASFSSRGPQRRLTDPLNAALKPDITAPGEAITSTALGTGNGAVTFGGTSMASPHVAGTVALLRQEHPTWTVAEIKALVMNTATHLLTDGTDNYDPARVGTGRLDVANAVASNVIAYNQANPELVSVSWGIQEVTGVTSQTKYITVENKGANTQVIFNVSYLGLADIPGVTFTVSPTTNLTVPAGGQGTITVTLDINPAAMVGPHTHAPTVSETQLGLPRFWLSEESGLVQLELVRGPATDLWVPVYVSARPASQLQATTDPLPVSGMTGFTTIDMAGTGVDTGTNYPYDVLSVVTALELYDESPDESEAAYGLPDEANSADLEYIGVTSDYNSVVSLGGGLGDTHVYFGISTYGDWASISEETWFEVYIDFDQDGIDDYLVYNWNLGPFAGASSNDVFVSVVRDLSTPYVDWYGDYVNYLEPDIIDTAPFQSRALVFGMWADLMGLTTDTDPAFDFWVLSWYKDNPVDISSLMTYDPTAQALDFTLGFTGASIWEDFAGSAVPLEYDWSVYEGPNPPCVLLIHHNNVDALKAETICLQVSVTHDVGVTITVDNAAPFEGDPVVFTITAINNVATDPVGAILVPTLPAGLTYVSDTVSQGSYSTISNQWTIGVLPPSGTATMTLTASVDAGTAGSTLTTSADISGTVGTDTNPADNSASVDVVPFGPGGPEWQEGSEEGTGTAAGEVTVLPSTGYPPVEESQSSTNLLPFGLAGALALTLVVGLVLRRRKHA